MSTLLFTGYSPGVLQWALEILQVLTLITRAGGSTLQDLESLGLGPFMPPLPPLLGESFSLWGSKNGTKDNQIYTIGGLV